MDSMFKNCWRLGTLKALCCKHYGARGGVVCRDPIAKPCLFALILSVHKINNSEGPWDNMFAQLLPYPFGDLLVRGAYGTTLCLVRNPDSKVLFPPGTFPLGWIAKVRPVHPEVSILPLVTFVVTVCNISIAAFEF